MKNKVNYLIIGSGLILLLFVGFFILRNSTSPKISSTVINTGGIILLTNGTANAVIVVPVNASTAESKGAQELNSYLQKATGANFKVINEKNIPPDKLPIYVGNCTASQYLTQLPAYNNIKNDGYIIDITKDGIHLLGKKVSDGGQTTNNLTTKFAIYGFLEDYIGIHWYLPEVFSDPDFPADMGTYIPHLRTIGLGEKRDVQDPSFGYRALGNANKSTWPEYNRMNLLDNTQGFHINALAHTLISFIPPSQICKGKETDTNYKPEVYASFGAEGRRDCKTIIDTADDRLNSNGVKLSSICQDHFSDTNFIPSFSIGNKPNTLSCVQLMQEADASSGRKINEASQEAKDIIVQNIVKYIDTHPEENIVNIFPEDGIKFDELVPDGQNYSGYTAAMVNKNWDTLGPEKYRVLSKRMADFYHEITTRVHTERPNVQLMTGAYNAYRDVPLENLGYKFDPNVTLLITHQEGQNSPIEDKNNPENVRFNTALQGWENYYYKMGIYEYYNKAAMYGLPFPIVHSIRADIPYYKENGINFFFSQHDIDNIGTNSLNYYIASKLLWNSQADVTKILNDFYTNFYGPAALEMKAYNDTLEQRAIDSQIEFTPNLWELPALFTDDVLNKCAIHLNSAKKNIQQDKTITSEEKNLYLERIKLSEISLTYTKSVMTYLKTIESITACPNGTCSPAKLKHNSQSNNNASLLNTANEELNQIKNVLQTNTKYHVISSNNYVDRLISNVDFSINEFRRKNSP